MEEQVLKAMKEAGKPVRPGDIAKVLGVDSKEVSKACAELKKAGKIYSPEALLLRTRGGITPRVTHKTGFGRFFCMLRSSLVPAIRRSCARNRKARLSFLCNAWGKWRVRLFLFAYPAFFSRCFFLFCFISAKSFL